MSFIQKFCERQRNLLVSEWNSEVQATEEMLKTEGDTSLVARGIVLLNLFVQDLCMSLFGKVKITMELRSRGELPSHNLSSGDIVGVFEGSFQSAPLASGVVHSVSLRTIELLMDDDQAALNLEFTTKYKLAQLGSKVSHERLMRTITQLEEVSHPFVDVMFRVSSLSERVNEYESISAFTVSLPPDDPFHSLNKPQQLAVQHVLSPNIVSVIHGPPGTGKTRALSVAISALIKRNQDIKILACAPSNVGVDNLALALKAAGVTQLVRLGHPSRIAEGMLSFALDQKVKQSDFFESCVDIKKEIDSLLKYAGRKDKYSELRELKKDLKSREMKSVESVFRNVNVVCTTCTGAFDILKKYIKREEQFDVCVIDECGQGLEMGSWIPILQSRKIVLAGDHKQLPPTVKSGNTELSLSLFERAIEIPTIPITCKHLLSVQYRMNETIMQWSNLQFYDSQLTAHGSNAKNILVPCNQPVMFNNVDVTCVIQAPFVFCDTAGVDGMEEIAAGNHFRNSKSNPGEVVVINNYLKTLLNASVEEMSLSIISPYLKQTELIRVKLVGGEIFPTACVSTVDSFQGQESDIVIISLVRSNMEKQVGFLADFRRINVAVTRAKKHLFIVGDSETVSIDPVLKTLVDYAHNEGLVVSAEMFIQPGNQLEGGAMAVLALPKRTAKQKDSKTVVRPAPVLKPVTVESSAEDRAEDNGSMSDIPSVLASIPLNKTHCFPPTLSKSERKIIHELCDSMAGYSHGSSGTGNERYIWVARKAEVDTPVPIASFSASAKPSPMPVTSMASKKKTASGCPRTITQTSKKDTAPNASRTFSLPSVPGKCAHSGCPMSVKLIGLDCRFCGRVFCTAHAQAEVHGCGDKASKEAKKAVIKNTPKKVDPMATSKLQKKLETKIVSMQDKRCKATDKKT